MFQNLLTALPVVLAHFAVAIGIFVLGTALYLLVTPFHELKLIRAGNRAAGISLSGAVLGLAFPVSAALRAALGIFDIVAWGILAIAIQLVTYVVVDTVLRGMHDPIRRDEVAPALALAACQISVGLINAAAIGI